MSCASVPCGIIKSIDVNSWRDLEQYLEQYLADEGRWVFRGQECSEWSLSTRIERELDGIPRSASGKPYPEGLHGAQTISVRDRIELFVARAFQARAAEMMPRVPDKEDTLGWLSLMQHWGFPTRLLDVTASPYVALHFAVAPYFRCNSRKERSAALYAFNSVFLRGIASRLIGSSVHVNFSRQDVFTLHFFVERPKHLFVLPVHPLKIDSRMAAQQASFLIPTTIYEGFERCLTLQESKAHDLVTKFVLSDVAIEEVQRKLVRMNIHEASLFPDIHGYARLVSDSIQAFKRLPSSNWVVKLQALEEFKWPG